MGSSKPRLMPWRTARRKQPSQHISPTIGARDYTIGEQKRSPPAGGPRSLSVGHIAPRLSAP